MVTKILRFPRESEHIWENLPRFDPRRVSKTKWLIKSFLAERSIQLVFGERGSFKSTCMLAAAYAVSRGQSFLGMKVRRRRVLYIDYENPAHVLGARSDDLNLNLSDTRDLIVWDRFGTQPIPRPDDPILEAIVRECVLETGRGPWIIFDSWASLLKPGEGGEFTGQIAPIYAHLRKFTDLGATVSVLDHSRKHDKVTLYGRQDKEAKADSIHNFSLFPNRVRSNNPIIRVDSWLKRFAPHGVGSFAFEVQGQQDSKEDWHIAGLVFAPDPEQVRSHEEIELLIGLIGQSSNSGQERLARLAAKKGLPRDKAISLLKEGTGKYWRVERIEHGKHMFSLIQK
jgi:hypothetical protein